MKEHTHVHIWEYCICPSMTVSNRPYIILVMLCVTVTFEVKGQGQGMCLSYTQFRKYWQIKLLYFHIIIFSLWPSRSSKVKGRGVKWKRQHKFICVNNCNYVSIWRRLEDPEMFLINVQMHKYSAHSFFADYFDCNMTKVIVPNETPVMTGIVFMTWAPSTFCQLL